MRIPNKIQEFFAVFMAIFILIVSQWQLWIKKSVMVTHDSIRWYGIFSYFVDCLHNGFLPLWNPYMNCGELFFLNIAILRLWDPSTLILVLIGKLLKIDFLSLYQYDLLLRYLIFIIGCYAFFKVIAKHKISAFIGFITITFSSLSLTYLRQHAFILHIYLLPWILYFIFRFIEDRNPNFLLGVAFFLGISLPSYGALFSISFIFILCVMLFATRSISLVTIKSLFKNYKILISAILILLLISMRVIPLGIRFSHDIIPTVRMYETVNSAESYFVDFFMLLTPYYYFTWAFIPFVRVSESLLYIGLIPLLLSIIGLRYSKHKYKYAFLGTTVITACLMLGRKTAIYTVFRWILPFFYLIRNTHTFGPFFIFCLSYFVCLGTDVIFDAIEEEKIKFIDKAIKSVMLFIFLFVVLIISSFVFYYIYTLTLNGGFYAGVNNIGFFIPVIIFLDSVRYSGWFCFFYLLFFIFGCLFLIDFLKRRNIYRKIKYFMLIFVVIFELLCFSRFVLYLGTTQKASLASNITVRKEVDSFKDRFRKFDFGADFSTYSPDFLLERGRIGFPIFATRFTHSDYRIRSIPYEVPFVCFFPAIVKQFTAYTDFVIGGSHFFEMKDYYKLLTIDMPLESRNILSGISAPKLRLVQKAIVLPHISLIDALKKTNSQTVLNAVFLEQELPSGYKHLETSLDNLKEQEHLDLGDIQIIHFNPNELLLDVACNQDSLLYYSDGYDKSWRVFIDGREGKVYKTNIAFKSTIVEKGKHRVRFIYDPKLNKISLTLYFIGIIISIIIFIRYMIELNRKDIKL